MGHRTRRPGPGLRRRVLQRVIDLAARRRRTARLLGRRHRGSHRRCAGPAHPTVRLRYLAARDLLTEYGRPEFHEELLGLLGCAHLTRERVEHHLRALTEVFDATAHLARTSFFFASDITPAARPIAIDGSLDLIRRGHHRESVFWIVATYARCLKILAHDAPAATQALFTPGFGELLDDLGITSPAGLQQRARHVHAFLPRLREVTEAILAANPAIQD